MTVDEWGCNLCSRSHVWNTYLCHRAVSLNRPGIHASIIPSDSIMVYLLYKAKWMPSKKNEGKRNEKNKYKRQVCPVLLCLHHSWDIKMLDRQKLKCFFLRDWESNYNNIYSEYARFNVGRFTHNKKIMQNRNL